jgi:ABC-type multidrug transport system permease subunit
VLDSLGIRYEDRWRNFGLMWVFVLVNVVAALGLYWLARVPKGKRDGVRMSKAKVSETQQTAKEK